MQLRKKVRLHNRDVIIKDVLIERCLLSSVHHQSFGTIVVDL